MLISVQHKKTACKNETAFYTYIVIDDQWGEREISFPMDLRLATRTRWLAPIAVFLAYEKQDRLERNQALDQYYHLLQREGFDAQAIRAENMAFYREALANREVAKSELQCG